MSLAIGLIGCGVLVAVAVTVMMRRVPRTPGVRDPHRGDLPPDQISR